MCSVLETIRSEITTDASWKNKAHRDFGWAGVDVVPLKCEWSLHTVFTSLRSTHRISFLLFYILAPYILELLPCLPSPNPTSCPVFLTDSLPQTPNAGHETCRCTALQHEVHCFGVPRPSGGDSGHSKVRWTNLQDDNASASATCSKTSLAIHSKIPNKFLFCMRAIYDIKDIFYIMLD